MNIYLNPPAQEWEKLCARPADINPIVTERVESIISAVAQEGDKAIIRLAKEIDGLETESLEMTAVEIEQAAKKVSAPLKKAIENARKNIMAFHSAQMPQSIKIESAPGVTCMQKPVPISRVGLYIPGGTAPLFSTVLMLAIPAKLAGCREIVLCSPASRQDGQIAPAVVYAASLCGVDRIFKVGGAQAIAAMAYGTPSIPKVDKIFGPGNQYVTTAKQLLGGRKVAIDMPAGPSEVMVLADESANPAFVAADLLSQAEHGRDSQVVLLCTKKEITQKVLDNVRSQSASLGREEYIQSVLEKSNFIVFDKSSDIIDFANLYAPEHLIVSMNEPWSIVDRITAAGSIFVGNWSPESAGDYASGTNHTLPTCGWASSFSGVNMDSFFKKITVQQLSREGLASLAQAIIEMARNEGLEAHANAVKIRTL